MKSLFEYNPKEKMGIFWAIFFVAKCSFKNNFKNSFQFISFYQDFFMISEEQVDMAINLDLTYALSFIRQMNSEKKKEVYAALMDIANKSNVIAEENKVLMFILIESGIKQAVNQ